MENLAKKKCVPCEGGIPPLENQKIQEFLSQVEDWQLEERDNHKQIVKNFRFDNFVEAMKFVNKVADIAESEGHHPNIDISYNKVKLTNYTTLSKDYTITISYWRRRLMSYCSSV